MPAGPQAMGFVYFAAAKFAGYSAFCRWAIQPQLNLEDSGIVSIPSALKAGAVRTLIGVILGAIVGLSFWNIPYFSQGANLSEVLFFSVLIPVRVGEWWLLLHWIYNGFHLSKEQRIFMIFTGILVSFILDAIGIAAALVLPGGMWVC